MGYLLWKCGGWTPTASGPLSAPSTITLGGLVKHLAAVEAITFSFKLRGRAPFAPFDSADWDDEGWHWRVEDTDTPASLERLFRDSVAHGQRLLVEAIAATGLGGDAEITDDHGDHANVRRLVLDMIEEYSRHGGHADLSREWIDGLVGEDPPGATA